MQLTIVRMEFDKLDLKYINNKGNALNRLKKMLFNAKHKLFVFKMFNLHFYERNDKIMYHFLSDRNE